MPLSYDQISAITQSKIMPKLVDNIFDSDPLLQRAKDKGWMKPIDGGTSVILPLNYAQTTASGWYSGAETLSTTDNEVISGASYDWKQLYANITISRRDELKNSGDAQIIDFVKSKVKIAEKTMKDKLQDGLYSDGSDAKEIAGLEYIMSTTNSPGGISQSSYSWWQPELDTSTTTLSIAAMQAIYNAVTINNESPTVIMTTRAVYNKFYALLQPQQRFMDEKTANAGFSSLMFNGTPVIAGSKVPTGDMYFLNENYMHLLPHKDENFRYEKFQKPVNQNISLSKIYLMIVFGFDNLRMHGALTAIA